METDGSDGGTSDPQVYILVEGGRPEHVVNEGDRRILRRYNPSGLGIAEKRIVAFLAGAVSALIAIGGFYLYRISVVRDDIARLERTVEAKERTIGAQGTLIRKKDDQASEFQDIIDNLSLSYEMERTALVRQRDLNRDVLGLVFDKLDHMEKVLPGILTNYFGPTEELLSGLRRFVDEPYVAEDLESYRRLAVVLPASLGEAGQKALLRTCGVDQFALTHEYLKLPFEDLGSLVVVSYTGLRNVYEYIGRDNVRYLYTKYHKGTDFVNTRNPRIVAPFDCRIVIYRDRHPETSDYISLGRMAVLEFETEGGTYRYIIGHIAQDRDIPIRPTPGKPIQVAKGTLIGNIGDSGYATGPTAHVECWYWSPTLQKWELVDLFTQDRPQMKNRLYIDSAKYHEWREIRAQYIM